MISVSHVSKSRIAGNLEEVKLISDTMIECDRETEATGCLYCGSDFFVVEGRRADVMGLIRKICRDRRHRDIRVIDGLEIEERRLGSWSMKLINGLSNLTLSNAYKRDGFEMSIQHICWPRGSTIWKDFRVDAECLRIGLCHAAIDTIPVGP